MTTFLLVAGAFHGDWAWERVQRLLEAEGHAVHAFDLTGQGAKTELATPDVKLWCCLLDYSYHHGVGIREMVAGHGHQACNRARGGRRDRHLRFSGFGATALRFPPPDDS